MYLGIDPVEVHKHMLARESEVPKFGHHSPQLKHRDWLVEWIGTACQRFSLTTTCVHLSVLIMDLFMDNFIIDDEQLHLLAISCVQISGMLQIALLVPKHFDGSLPKVILCVASRKVITDYALAS